MINQRLSDLEHRLETFISRFNKRFVPEVLVLFGYILLTIIVTYPHIRHLQGNWLMLRDTDTYVKLWDIWYFDRMVHGLESPYSTTSLFFPTGVSLAYHSFSWIAVSLAWLLAQTSIFTLVDAYDLSIIIGLLSSAYGGYLFGLYMTDNRGAAWLCGFVYAFAPYHIDHSGGHPDLIYLFLIPLCMILFLKAIDEPSNRSIISAGILFGLNAFCSLYILGLASITLAFCGIYLAIAHRRFSDVSYWLLLAKIAVIGIVISLPIALPAVLNIRELFFAIESKLADAGASLDILSLVIPYENYFLNRWFDVQFEPKHSAYLGMVPIALMVYGLLHRNQRDKLRLWLGLGLFFFILSLGTVLTVADKEYPAIFMPARLFTWIPLIRIFRRSDFFILGLLLPLSGGAALGLHRLHTRLKAGLIGRWVITGLVTGFLFFEYWFGPYTGISPARLSTDVLEAMPDQAAAVVNLPMGRQASKTYVYLQTIHEHPLVEGMVSRTPEGAYDYIQANSLLAAWESDQPLSCDAATRASLDQAASDLLNDNVGYIMVDVYNLDDDSAVVLDYFTHVDPIYEDNTLEIYAVGDLVGMPACDAIEDTS